MGAEAARYAGTYSFQAGYRFQFEHAVVSFEGGKCIIYEYNGTVTNFTNQAEGDTGSINLPKSDAYAEEIRYFTDCVKKGAFLDKVKPEELRAVIELLKELQA